MRAGANRDTTTRAGPLGDQGAVLVEIEAFEIAADNFWSQAHTVLLYEFKVGLNAYLSTAAPAVTARSLADVIAFNEAHAAVELALFGQELLTEAEAAGSLDDAAYRSALAAVQRASREDGIDALLTRHNVDALVAPSAPIPARIDPINGDVWPDWVGAGYLAAIAGYPHVSVPVGTIDAVPVGFSIIGKRNDDATLLSYAYAYEQSSRLRAVPGYLPGAEALEDIRAAFRPAVERR
ncbi:MAG: amidase family protein [Pseudomonadota bacterium]